MELSKTLRRFALMMSVLLLCGCGARERVTLYRPAEGGLTASVSRVEVGPEGIVRALTETGALPEAEGGYLYCACRTEDYTLDGDTRERRVVRLDIGDALGRALIDMEDERPAVQALVNTFLGYYGADVLVLTVEGVDLQTLREHYDHGIRFDEYAATAG